MRPAKRCLAANSLTISNPRKGLPRALRKKRKLTLSISFPGFFSYFAQHQLVYSYCQDKSNGERGGKPKKEVFLLLTMGNPRWTSLVFVRQEDLYCCTIASGGPRVRMPQWQETVKLVGIKSAVIRRRISFPPVILSFLKPGRTITGIGTILCCLSVRMHLLKAKIYETEIYTRLDSRFYKITLFKVHVLLVQGVIFKCPLCGTSFIEKGCSWIWWTAPQ